MEAIIFDIDGTLIDSDEADGRLFLAAVHRVLGIADASSDWTTYRNVTDEGVLRQIMQVHGIGCDPTLMEATKREFVSLLAIHIEQHGPFREIPGALSYVRGLLASEHHYMAYATGGWRESALLKLESAGFPTRGVPISTSSDFEDRTSIMKAALSAAPSALSRITYYGDGVWDEAAARSLDWDFVPVGEALDGLRNYDEAAPK